MVTKNEFIPPLEEKEDTLPWEISSDLLWIYPQNNPDLKQKIIEEFKIHPAIAQVLVSRGFKSLEEVHKHLYAQLPDLYDPFIFADMEKAVIRLAQAMKAEETVLVFGDNDVDGMSGTALLINFFETLGIKSAFYIPDSKIFQEDVFGQALNYALQLQSRLFITVDCGITAPKELQRFIDHGIDVIITDHHEPTTKIPNCIATLNPKLVGNPYPNRELTGVGVAFKLAHALTQHLVKEGLIKAKQIDLKSYLDFVALGTISDMGSLLEENRILVRYGLKELQNSKRLGLQQLFPFCEIDSSTFSTMDVSTKIAPRLNSLGRIANPKMGVELLLTRDVDKATIMAHELELNNIERQKVERLVLNDIEAYINSHPEVLKEKALFFSSPNWHIGIIAIIAARLTKRYNRPTVVVSENIKDIGKGSIRTIKEFPLLTVLKDSAEYLINYGGHDYAAGFTIRKSHIEKFKKNFISFANTSLKDRDIIAKLFLDGPLNFNDLTFDTIEFLNLLRPFGNENPPPIFYCDARQVWLPRVFGKEHLKLFLEQDDRMLEGIAFNLACKKDLLKKKNQMIRIAFTPQINIFRSKMSIQLIIRDFQLIN